MTTNVGCKWAGAKQHKSFLWPGFFFYEEQF